jgi:hypothetical protein
VSWAKLDDRFHSHAKPLGCSLAAVGTFALSLSWAGSQEKDGVIPTHVALHLARGDGAIPDELVRVGLWDTHPDGYAVHDYLHYNPSSKHLARKRKDAKSRMRALRVRSREQTGNISSVARHPVPRGRDGTGTGVPRSGSEGGVGGFDRFWSAYPRKVAKQEALKAWTKLAPDIALEIRILGAVDHQRTWDAWTRDGGKFIPYPATWLNGRRWEDERATVATPLLTPRGQAAQAASDEWVRRRAGVTPAPEQPRLT